MNRPARKSDAMRIGIDALRTKLGTDVAQFVAAPPGYRIIELDDDGYSTSVVRLSEARYAPVQQ